jgi:hypothetical protein
MDFRTRLFLGSSVSHTSITYLSRLQRPTGITAEASSGRSFKIRMRIRRSWAIVSNTLA